MKTLLCIASSLLPWSLAQAQTPPPAPAFAPTISLATPGMSGPLAFASPPHSIDTGVLGKWYVDGVLSGLGMVQSNPTRPDKTGLVDFSNAQIIIQKIDGVLQFYVQAGAYAIPSLGTQYSRLTDTENALHNFYGAVPQAFLKIAPNDTFAIEAGNLPTLIGPEDTFTFENFDIERGLLWNQEPAVSRGVQANYVHGPLTFSLSLNDGYYSDRFNWLSGAVTWVINRTNTLLLSAGANLGSTGPIRGAVATPTAQNNSSIYNLAYTYNAAPFIVTPYLQFSNVPANAGIGIYKSASTYSAAILANYNLTPKFSLSGRLEYIGSNGGKSYRNATNLLYGAGSGAFSATLTPTFTYHRLFARGDLSLVEITSGTDGLGFGSDGDQGTQFRAILETGVIF